MPTQIHDLVIFVHLCEKINLNKNEVIKQVKTF
jgi:hypothetical protein